MDERKKLKMILGLLMWFMIYMGVMGILIFISLFNGTWNRFLDLGLYIGNVVAFGLSFYIMNRGKKLKMPFLIITGIFVFLANAWGIVRFYL
jgi:hypothetical protein